MTKAILWIIFSVILTTYGIYTFFTEEITQNIILGFATWITGFLMFGWNMAVYQHSKRN